MTNEQILQIEHSFSHGDNLVFQVGERVFVSDTVLKHHKEATIEMQDCSEVDDTCFEKDGEYYGDICPRSYNIILADPYAGNDYEVASVYYEDEIVELVEVL